MKKILLVSLLMACFASLLAQWPLSYYLPKEISYNSAIPKPSEIIGHDVGEWHITHDKLYYYMLELARISDRAVWEEYA